MWDLWLEGFKIALSGNNLLMLLLGSGIGLLMGVLPVVGPSFGVTLVLSFTFGLEPAAAMILLCAIQAACVYGDSIASILVNVPGGPGTVATMWEGYPMTRKGKAGTALGIATASSFIGGLMGWVSFVFLAGPMTAFALAIGAPEYTLLGFVALALVSLASKGETLKGLIMACLGLLISMIGADPVTGMTYRFAYGLLPLEAGVEITLGALAVFAIPQLVQMLAEGGSIAKVAAINDSVIGGALLVLRRPITVIRAGIIGWLVGVLPALGTSAAGIASYLTEKKFSKEKELFGTGSVDGLIAAEAGKGACVLGDGITSLMLGVPGSVTWAILMAALIMHGVQPGPRLMTSGALPYAIFAGLLLSQFVYFIVGLSFVKYLAKLVYIPNQILAPAVAVLCFLGAYVAKNYEYDIWIMVGLGIFAFIVGRAGYPPVPMILGFILGPLIESNFHRSLAIGYGSPLVFLQRPICILLIAVIIIGLSVPWISEFIKRRRAGLAARLAVLNVEEGEGVRATAAPASTKEKPAIAVPELFAAGFVGILLAIFLTTSLHYKANVRLFPVIVTVVGLGLLLVWLLTVVRGSKIAPFNPRTLLPSREDVGLFPGYTLLLLVGYTLGVWAFGFIPASVAFLIAAAWLAHYRNWKVIGATAVAVGLVLMVFPQFLRVTLPVGWVMERLLGL